MQRLAILGTGLIGGSLARAWQQRRPDLTLVGYDRPAVLDEAYARGFIDERAADPITAAKDADIVVLATPLAASLQLLEQIAPHLAPGTLVTDVGSVKVPIMEQAAAVLPDGLPFVGGHPMAGSEQGGLDHADSFLFENATYVLCPAAGGSSEDLTTQHAPFVELIRATGARVLVMDAARHDRIAAAVSHLPQLLAVALTDYVADGQADDEAFLQLAAGGFRDMTRIASSPFNLWRDILIANQRPILDTLGGFASTLQRLRNRLIEEDLDALGDVFDDARHVRERIPRDSKGFLQPLADVYVYAEDRPGELLRIVRACTEADLNIKDIELLKIREGTGGAFRLSFGDDARADDAVDALTAADFHAYRL